MVRERTTKKITFEIDIEKILKYLFFFAFAVLVIIYGYKGFMNVYDYFNKQSQPSYKIAVLDMPELRKEFSSITETVLLTMIDLNSKNISEH